MARRTRPPPAISCAASLPNPRPCSAATVFLPPPSLCFFSHATMESHGRSSIARRVDAPDAPSQARTRNGYATSSSTSCSREERNCSGTPPPSPSSFFLESPPTTASPPSAPPLDPGLPEPESATESTRGEPPHSVSPSPVLRFASRCIESRAPDPAL